MNTIDISKIEVSPYNTQKHFRTRSCEGVFIYWVGKDEIHGRIHGLFGPSCWDLDGTSVFPINNSKDLVPYKYEESCYANEYQGGVGSWFTYKDMCINSTLPYKSIGIIKKTIKSDGKVILEYLRPDGSPQ